jgi:hypothetical protein
MKTKVKQMTSSRSGNPVANQFIIYTAEGDYFQSYDSVIVANNHGEITLDSNTWDHAQLVNTEMNF